MKVKIPFFIILSSFSILSANSSSMQQMMQQKYEEFVAIDEQIESLVKQQLQLQGELAEHMQREETAIRPRIDRRQAEMISSIEQQLQQMNAEFQQLEAKRTQILFSMKQP